MSKAKTDGNALNLKAGEWVQVRSQEEILATLDEHGRLENLPFMPEMLEFCGRKIRVFKRSDKTCDPAHAPWSIRRMTDSVHLEDARCSGQWHGGCQASCLLFWKEGWLKRVDDSLVQLQTSPNRSPANDNTDRCTVATIAAASCRQDSPEAPVYSCQATELRSFTFAMHSLNPSQYIRDLRSRNLDTGLSGDAPSHRILEMLLGVICVLRAVVISFFNQVQGRRHGMMYPFIHGSAVKDSGEMLNLQPGELVQVRTKEEIMTTLDSGQRNRGLWFDSEMLPYCGGIYRVLRRVQHILDEKTGKMIHMKRPCIVLEGVVCRSDYHRLCPRSIYPYWRESWLKRAAPDVLSAARDHSERNLCQPTAK